MSLTKAEYFAMFDKRLNYLQIFTQSIGVVEDMKIGQAPRYRCKGCGAPDQSGRCSYCGEA